MCQPCTRRSRTQMKGRPQGTYRMTSRLSRDHYSEFALSSHSRINDDVSNEVYRTQCTNKCSLPDKIQLFPQYRAAIAARYDHSLKKIHHLMEPDRRDRRYAMMATASSWCRP
jgi:hypothetical protein